MEQIFHVPKRQRKPNLQQDRQSNVLRVAVKVLEGVCFRHEQRLRDRPTRLKAIPSDTALPVESCILAQSQRARVNRKGQNRTIASEFETIEAFVLSKKIRKDSKALFHWLQ